MSHAHIINTQDEWTGGDTWFPGMLSFFRKVSQYHNYLIFKGTRGKLGIVRFVENPLVGYGLPGKKVSHFLDYV